MLKKCGLPFLNGYSRGVYWKTHTEERKVAKNYAESPVEIENSEATTEADAETSTESAY